MKPVEEMNAMEVCAYLVAKSSKGLLGKDELVRLYDLHCAKLKAELNAGGTKAVSEDFKRELLTETVEEARTKEESASAGETGR